MIRNFFIIVCLLFIGYQTSFAQIQPNLYKEADQRRMNQWADSVFDSLSLDERIGQLFMVVTDPRSTYHKTILGYIDNMKIGGVLFSKGTLQDQAQSINLYQKNSRVPLLISFDGEWGLAMRLQDTPRFPQNMLLGAVNDNQLIQLYGEEMGRECRELGVHINFAPTLDVNVNPANPVIGMRSFGENPQAVAEKGIAYSKGLENRGVMSVAKHFPGHGDTSDDSHKTLPKITHSRQRLDEVELYPFSQFINSGLGGVMTGHLSVPALDNTSGQPTSLSKRIVTDLLQEELGFRGLTFTDALAMKGASTETGQSTCVKALLAGNDILLNPRNPSQKYANVKKAVEKGVIKREMIEEKCLKILRYKYIAGLNHYKPIEVKGLSSRINTSYAKWLVQRLNAEGMTLLKNEEEAIPVKHLGSRKVAVLSIGEGEKTNFQQTMELYDGFDMFYLSREPANTEIANVFKQLKGYDTIICAIHSSKVSDYSALQSLAKEKDVILCFLISPYRLSKFKQSIASAKAVVLGYENTSHAQQAAAELIMGGIPAKGKLPVTIPGLFKYGSGLSTEKVRLSYQEPRERKMSVESLRKIDQIAQEGIKNQAYPGCQILVAKDGVVVYNKSFGYFDYAKTHKVENSDLYDLASVTKAVATVPAVMKLYDEKKITLPSKLSKFIPELVGTDKADITVRDALFHETGLVSFIPFYRLLIDTDSYEGPLYSNKRDLTYRTQYDTKVYMRNDFQFKSDMVCTVPQAGFDKQVADGFYVKNDIDKLVLNEIACSKLRKTKGYLYSDLNFMLLKRMTENISKQTFDVFLEKNFFANLGANNTLFLPLRKIDKTRIAPTENDEFLRNQVIVGFPHDEAAAVLGGVSGNAGLFSNTNDLAKILQMLLNDGEYGGERYLSQATCRTFTKTKSKDSRRGLGFDKPDKVGRYNPAADSAPECTYGHTGFTGTCFWVDPDNKLIYIFLANRVYPSRTYKKLTELNIRTRIQDVIYEAMQI